MIDVVNEEMIPFSVVAKWCEKTIGNRPHVSTLHRWRLRGVRGVKLETILIGGKRFTSIEALLRFIESSSKDNNLPGHVSLASAKRRREIEAAEAYLASEGI